MELLGLDFYFTSFQMRSDLFQSSRQELHRLQSHLSLTKGWKETHVLTQQPAKQHQTPALASSPCPACVKLKSLPAQHKAGGARGVLFSSLRAFYLFQAGSLPQPWSERKSRGNGAQHPEVAPPSPRGRINSLRAGRQPSADRDALLAARGYSSGTGPILLPCTDRHCCPAPEPSAKRKDIRGQTCHLLATVPHPFPAHPSLLLPYLPCSRPPPAHKQ